MSAVPRPPQISIMIVAYNSAALIASCIESIGPACRRHTYEVLLIDNGDGTTEALVRRDFPEVRLVPSRGNIGFAGGNNAIAQVARGEFLLLLNPDVVLYPEAIDILADGAHAHHEAAAWGGVTVDHAGRPDTGNAIAFPSLIELASTALGKSLVALRPIRGVQEDAQVDVLSGGFVMFSSAVWNDLGGLNESFFLYCEEVDLFWRLRKKGYGIWRIAGSKAFHASGHGDGFSPMRLLYMSAGRMEFMRQHWPMPLAVIGGGLIWLAAVQRFVAGRVLGRWHQRSRQMSNGYRHVAAKPGMWFFGYDKQRGLLVKLGTTKGFSSPITQHASPAQARKAVAAQGPHDAS